GRATEVRVLVEDCLAGVGEQCPGGGLHAVRLAPAVPGPALLVEIADVAHAVPPGAAVLDLRERRLPFAPEIFAGDDRAFDDQLANPAAWEDQPFVPGRNHLVGDPDDPKRDARKRSAHASPLAGAGEGSGIPQDFARGD